MYHSNCFKAYLILVLVLAMSAATIGEEYQSSADKIHSQLSEMLNRADADESVKVLVLLQDRVDARNLARQFDTRHERHVEVVTALQEKAAITQADMLVRLDELAAANQVIEYTNFWITNAIAIDAYPEAIYELSTRPEVEKIYVDYTIELIEPVEKSASGPLEAPGAPEPGLTDLNVRPMWDLGYFGSGVIVSNFDTGVNGNHPALDDRWYGNVVPWQQAWNRVGTPTDNFPNAIDHHGTHTMGTITGLDPATQDTIGMAPAAWWIAARWDWDGNINNFISDIIEGFEWLADPDGDPQTSDDVPVTNGNSWGTGPLFGQPPCDDAYFSAMDGLEAAGCAIVFAAGNEGPSPSSHRNPAERSDGAVNAFSVGSLNAGSATVSSFSSRGPTVCANPDPDATKPEVMARGSSVRSAYGNTYLNLSGTSMATPHVAGAIALLAEAHPNATPEDWKMALYETAVDLGTPGEDNDYGKGRIDVYAAHLWLLGTGGGPDLDVTLDLDSNSGNGSFVWEMTFDNTTGGTHTADVWGEIETPSGSTILAFQKTRNWAAGVSTKNLNFNLPGAAPVGTYTLTLYSGTYPSTIDDSDSETYNKTSLAAPAGNTAQAEVVPSSIVLDQNYPNPFNPNTNIRFGLDVDSPVTIKIYNSLGQQVKTLVSGVYAAGYHTVEWNGTNDAGQQVATGLYVYRMEAGDRILSQRMFFSK